MRTLWLTVKALAGLALAVAYLLALLALFFFLRDPSIKPLLGWLALPLGATVVWVLWPERDGQRSRR